jgi:hypothetical protein
MDRLALTQAGVILALAALAWSIGHAGRLLMRRMKTGAWLAGTAFGFVAFLVSRLALAGAAWVIYTALFGDAPDPLALVALVGVASTPLLLSFVHVTGFFGPGVLFILYLISWLRLTSLTSLALNMDWLGCLGWWTAAWLLSAGAGHAIRWLLRDATWLGWTGIFGQKQQTPADLLAELPGLRMGRRAG